MSHSQGMSKSPALCSNPSAYDCPSFSELLKRVLAFKSSTVRFQELRNHDRSQNNCNAVKGSLSSTKVAAGSPVDSVQNEDGADISTCWEYIRQSSGHMDESAQQSSSSFNGIIGEVQEGGAEPRPKNMFF